MKVPNTYLAEKIWSYYKKYYRCHLGLPDWKKRCKERLEEEVRIHKRLLIDLQEILKFLGQERLEGKKILEVGCGTGGFSLIAREGGMDAYGIDSDVEAIEICRLKASNRGMKPSKFQVALAEALPFKESSFDLVYCSSVLEHVSEVKKTCEEILRVTRPEGLCYIVIPNYLVPHEGHYKIIWFPMMPKFLGKLYLRLLNKPTQFISTINYTTPQRVESFLATGNRSRVVYKAGRRKFVNFSGWKGFSLRTIQHLYYRLFRVDAEITLVIQKLY